VLLDNLYVPGSSTPISRTDETGDTYQLRALASGETFEVLKNFPTEGLLRAEARASLRRRSSAGSTTTGPSAMSWREPPAGRPALATGRDDGAGDILRGRREYLAFLHPGFKSTSFFRSSGGAYGTTPDHAEASPDS
jgi:hypothetical protein